MSFHDAWRNISARIKGLNEAAKLNALIHPNATSTGSTRFLQEQAREVFSELNEFHNRFKDILPIATRTVLERADGLVFKPEPSAPVQYNRGTAANDLIHLQAIESAVTFSLADTDNRVFSTTELALQHLQRSLVVEESLRSRWDVAFERGETYLEQLGAVHLLSHGIFAFKVNAAGARTDLVMPDKDPAEASMYATGLVLTEWKKADGEKDAAEKFEEARTQARLYASGPLASVELRGTRYAIVVTKNTITHPKDLELDGIRYRHVNIVISQSVPSIEARPARRRRAVSA
jgi:hypothetical protein